MEEEAVAVGEEAAAEEEVVAMSSKPNQSICVASSCFSDF